MRKETKGEREIGAVLGTIIALAFTPPDNSMMQDNTLTTRQKIKEGFRDMKVKSLGYAKNFALFGFVYSSVECTIEKVTHSVLRVYFQGLVELLTL